MKTGTGVTIILKIIFSSGHIFETLAYGCSYLTIREKVDWKTGDSNV